MCTIKIKNLLRLVILAIPCILMGVNTNATVTATEIDVNNTYKQADTKNAVEYYFELYENYIKKLDYYASIIEKAKENRIYSTSAINAIQSIVEMIAKNLNDGKIPANKSNLIEGLERAQLSTYFDKDYFGFEISNRTKSIKESSDKQFKEVFALLGVKQVESTEEEGSNVANSNATKNNNAATHWKETIEEQCKTHFSPVFSKGTILEEKVVEAYSKGTHSIKCIDYVAQMYTKNTFKDVEDKVWYKEGVAHSYQLKLMSGEADHAFNPRGDLTVAQTIAIASRLNSIYTTGNLGAIPEVAGGEWYDGVVRYAVDNSIIKSSEFSSSAMNKPATRGQVAYILGNSIPSKELEVINETAKFSDVTNKTFYSDSILKLAKAGVLVGKTDTEFKVSDVVTRAEASIIIARLIKPSSRIQIKVGIPENTSKTVY